METTKIAKRSATNFVVFAACAFVLWILAFVINWLAQIVNLSTPDHLVQVTTSLGSSQALQAIFSIWLLTAAVAVIFPKFASPLSATTTLVFEVGSSILGALAGFGLAIGIFSTDWRVFLISILYSAIIAAGYFAARKWFPATEIESYGQSRWIVAGILALASPFILLWG